MPLVLDEHGELIRIPAVPVRSSQPSEASEEATVGSGSGVHAGASTQLVLSTGGAQCGDSGTSSAVKVAVYSTLISYGVVWVCFN